MQSRNISKYNFNKIESLFFNFRKNIKEVMDSYRKGIF